MSENDMAQRHQTAMPHIKAQDPYPPFWASVARDLALEHLAMKGHIERPEAEKYVILAKILTGGA